ncbi:MAG: hypothetical protein ACI9LF_001010, partial [Flavobacteriales bacterium]
CIMFRWISAVKKILIRKVINRWNVFKYYVVGSDISAITK